MVDNERIDDISFSNFIWLEFHLAMCIQHMMAIAPCSFLVETIVEINFHEFADCNLFERVVRELAHGGFSNRGTRGVVVILLERISMVIDRNTRLARSTQP